MTVSVKHADLTGAAANPNVLVDGVKWDKAHNITQDAAGLIGANASGNSDVLTSADFAAEASPAAGDGFVIYTAEGGLALVDYSSLPGAGGGISNVVEDTTPQLGGDLDLNGHVITGLEIGTDVQAYDANAAAYDDTTANFTGTLQNGGSNVVVDSDIGSTVQAYDADLAAVAALTTTAAGLTTLEITDPNADRVLAWDDTAGAVSPIALADLTAEAAPASGDKFLIYGAEGDLRAVDYDNLPGAGGGLSNVVEDTTPQLGGDLDLNGHIITGFDTTDTPQFAGIEIGAATDTTLSRASAGQLAVEGVNIAMAGGAFHDGFSDFVADEHVAHSGVTLTAGDGLTGGGTIEASRSFAVGAGTGIDVAADAVSVEANTRTASANFVIDGGGSAITTGIKGDLQIDFACTITGAYLLADQTGSIAIDIWKDSYANFPPTDADSITASAQPTISSSTKDSDATLTGWTTSVAAGDILRFNVDSVSTIERCTVVLTLVKT